MGTHGTVGVVRKEETLYAERTLDGYGVALNFEVMVNDILNEMDEEEFVEKYIRKAEWGNGALEIVTIKEANGRIVVEGNREEEEEYGVYVNFVERKITITPSLIEIGLGKVCELRKKLLVKNWTLESEYLLR